jgi:GT2 family glycosyltransferase
VNGKTICSEAPLNDIGIVAIGRNEGERLRRCLTSLKSESRNIVYVDSGSTDGSVGAAKAIGACVVALDMSRPFTAARARNEGFAALRAAFPHVSYVQFVDGDCILVRGWLAQARAFIEQRSEVALVCGRRRELHPTASIYNQLCDMEWDTPIGEAASCGGDALVRVEAFEAVRGFRTELIAGEEPELCVRLRQTGRKIWRIDADMTCHDAALSHLGQFWTRAVRGGYAFAEVSRLHKTSSCGIWRRETARAILWGGVLPLTLCVGALFNQAVIAFALIYPIQAIRIAFKKGVGHPQSWKYALLISLAKFAEFQGVLMFYFRQINRRSAGLIEYK